MTRRARPEGGYRSLEYAQSLGAIGQPFRVEPWGTPVLLRSIAGASGRIDATGPYPLCQLDPDADLAGGLESLRDAGAISVVLVSDPLRGPGGEALQQAFTNSRPFKTHYILDRRTGPFDPSRHHRDRIRRGRRRTEAHRVSLLDPAWREQWSSLYQDLVRRRRLTGVHAFSEEAFESLSRLPKATLSVFAARSPDGETQAMQLWIQDDDRAYSHLTATSAEGYRSGATYVLYAAAIDHFQDCRFLDFGGGAGRTDAPDDPLAVFKRGFANTSASASLCTSILDAPAYAALSQGHADDFFPRYRAAAV